MSDKRQELVEAAIELFAEHGFHGTGIDRIAEVARVSKKTMYHHFRSKEELIVAALRHHDGLFRNHFMKAVDQAGNAPYERLLAIFDVAHDWFTQHNFYGCIFINAIGEYANRDSAIYATCKEYKRQMRAFVEELTSRLDVADPHGLALEIALLLEGSIVTAQVSGLENSAATAKKAAQTLIDDALGSASAPAST